MALKYTTTLDRESASELLAKRAAEAATEAQTVATPAENDADLWEVGGKPDAKFTRARRYDPKLTFPADEEERSSRTSRGGTSARRSSSDTVLETFSKSVARELGRSAPKIMRGVLGGLFRGR